MSNPFKKAVEDASQTPRHPDDESGDGNIFDWSGGVPSAVQQFHQQIDDKIAEKQRLIPKASKYDLKTHCKRLFIGNVTVGSNPDGFPIYEPRDDSDEYEAIMQEVAEAKALLFENKTTFLKDGSVVIWIVWATRPAKNQTADTPPLTREDVLG